MHRLAEDGMVFLRRVKEVVRPTIPSFRRYLPFVRGKRGLEIGGPSESFGPGAVLPIYSRVGTLDNCDFSDKTVWREHREQYNFSPRKRPGRSIFCEGSELTPIADDSYDFLLSCHNLEHFANPLKALHEWRRVVQPGGALIVVLPFYRDTFDHLRTPTPVQNMIGDFEHGIGEDDLSHLDEILAKHDLTRDAAAGSFEDFRKRSLHNIENRCLHHHVFDEENSRELLSVAGFTVLAVDVQHPGNLCLLSRR